MYGVTILQESNGNLVMEYGFDEDKSELYKECGKPIFVGESDRGIFLYREGRRDDFQEAMKLADLVEKGAGMEEIKALMMKAIIE